MAYQVSRYKQQSPFTKAMHGIFSSLSQTIPQYVGYKMEQKAEQQKRKDLEKGWKQKEKKMQLDFYTAMTKDRDPTVRGRAIAKIEELLGTMPYSAVVGQEKLRPRGMPSLGVGAPSRMPMGPTRGGMTTRQPSMGEIVGGAEQKREAGMTPYQTGQLGLGRERFTLQQKKDQRATDMNLINNYYATDEQGNFSMPYETAKMLEPKVKEAAMRQFGGFKPRLPAKKRPTIFRKDLPERLGTIQTQKERRQRAKQTLQSEGYDSSEQAIDIFLKNPKNIGF